MTRPDDIVPTHIVSDPDFWNGVAKELRTLAQQADYPQRMEAELEANDAEWRAQLLQRAWTDVAAFMRLVEARCDGLGLDVALMCAFPDA